MKGGVTALKEHGEDDNIADSNEAVIALHQFPSVLDSGGGSSHLSTGLTCFGLFFGFFDRLEGSKQRYILKFPRIGSVLAHLRQAPGHKTSGK